MPQTKPPYPPQFRAEAVRLVRESGKPMAQIARDLGVSAEDIFVGNPPFLQPLASPIVSVVATPDMTFSGREQPLDHGANHAIVRPSSLNQTIDLRF